MEWVLFAEEMGRSVDCLLCGVDDCECGGGGEVVSIGVIAWIGCGEPLFFSDLMSLSLMILCVALLL